MTGFEFAVTYAVCWWLVLFMVLPHQAEAPAEPGLGHAPSAPANPQLKKKLRLTTLIAILPAVAMYFIVSEAKAADEGIYHVGGKCKPVAAVPSDDLNVRDGFGTGDKQVAPANLGGGSAIAGQDHYDIPLLIPTAKYTSARNVDLSQSFANAGTLSVGKNGTTTLNGKSLTSSQTNADGCNDGIEGN